MADKATLTLHKHFQDVVGQGNTKHSFLADDGRKYTTFKAEIAAKAIPLVGQPVTLTYTFKQNGEYENYYIDDVSAINGASSQGFAPAASNAQGAGLPSVSSQATIDPRQQSIERQSSMKAAFEYAAASGLPLNEIQGVFDVALGLVQGTTEL